MSETSSGSGSPSPLRGVGTPLDHERGRRQTWHPHDRHFDSREGSPDASQTGLVTSRELEGMESQHRQLLMDNLRLWESVNVIRCNPRLNAGQVLRQIYSLTEVEFFRNYPAYAAYRQAGNGALSSLGDRQAGGGQTLAKYAQHVRVHNNGLLRENARLLLCLDLLNLEPHRTADEVLCHSFCMSDEDFAMHYPNAARGSRLQAQLIKLHDDERKRPRSRSLPGQIQAFLRPRSFYDSLSGPSCSNNNEVLLGGHADPYYSPGAAQIDRLHRKQRDEDGEEGYWRGGGHCRFPRSSLHDLGLHDDNGRERSFDCPARRCLLSPPPCGRDRRELSPSEDRQTSRMVGRSRGRSRSSPDVPYMLSQHPYNWATSNNSSARVEESQETQAKRYTPEGEKDRRKDSRRERLEDRAELHFGVCGVALKSVNEVYEERPKISFSEQPAFKKSDRNDTEAGDSGRQRVSSKATQSHKRTPPSKGDLTNRPLESEKDKKKKRSGSAKSQDEKKAGRSDSPRSASPKTKSGSNHHHDRASPLKSTREKSPEKKKGEKSVTFKQNDKVSSQPGSRRGSASRSPSASPRLKGADRSPERPKPMYYKPKSEKRAEKHSDDDSPDIEDVFSPRKRFTTKSRSKLRSLSPAFMSCHILPRACSPPEESSSAGGRRLSRSLSDETPVPAHGRRSPDRLSSSRHQLLLFRDVFREKEAVAAYDGPLGEARESYSADSLDRSPPPKGDNPGPGACLSLPRSCLKTPNRPSALRQDDQTVSTYTSLPSLLKASDLNLASPSERALQSRHSLSARSSIPALSPPHHAQCREVQQNVAKMHRSPTRRHRTASAEHRSRRTEERVKSSPPRLKGKHKTPSPRREATCRNDNAIPSLEPRSSSRFTRLRSSSEDANPEESLQFPLVFERSALVSGTQTVVDQLLQEKRQLDWKYSNGAQSFSAPASVALGTEGGGGGGGGGGREGRRMSQDHHLHSSNCEMHDEFETASAALSQRPMVVRAREEASLERDRNRSAHGVEDEDEATSCSLDNLRLGTEMLREEKDRCRQCRRRRVHSEDKAEEALAKAYGPRCRDGGTSQATRSHRHSSKNKNCNSSLTQDRGVPSWISILVPNEGRKGVAKPVCSANMDSQVFKRTQEALASRVAFYDAPASILGEVAFQLERLLIRQVYKGNRSCSPEGSSDNTDGEEGKSEMCNKRHRFYGFTVSNLVAKIRDDCRDPRTGKRQEAREAALMRRFQDLVVFLRDNHGYRVHKHARLCQELIKRYGLFDSPPDATTTIRLGLNDFRSVRNHVIKLSDPIERPDLLVLVDCLHALAKRENRPILCFE